MPAVGEHADDVQAKVCRRRRDRAASSAATPVRRPPESTSIRTETRPASRPGHRRWRARQRSDRCPGGAGRVAQAPAGGPPSAPAARGVGDEQVVEAAVGEHFCLADRADSESRDPAATCRRPTSIDLWVFACGRSATPRSAMADAMRSRSRHPRGRCRRPAPACRWSPELLLTPSAAPRLPRWSHEPRSDGVSSVGRYRAGRSPTR